MSQIPANIEAELAVLGALLLDPEAITRVAGTLKREDFYRPDLGGIYQAIVELHERGIPADMTILAEELGKKKLLDEYGGIAAIVKLYSSVTTATSIVHHAKIIKDKAVLRSLRKAGETISMVVEDDVDEAQKVLLHAEKLVQEIREKSEESNFEDSDIQHISVSREKALKVLQNPHAIAGQATGIRALDKLWLGMDAGDVIILAGDTAQGKSMLSQRIALNVATLQVPVLYCSLEMTLDKQTARFYSMDKDKYKHVADEVDKLPIHYYSGNAEMNLQILEKIISTAVRLHDIKVCFVDHLHYFSSSIDNVTSEIGIISRKLKRFAIKYKIPIVVISTLRKRTKKGMPGLGDLKDSVMIAYDADIVTMVWRDADGDDPQDVYVKVMKNRVRGNTGQFIMHITDDWDLVEGKSESTMKAANKVFNTTPYADKD